MRHTVELGIIDVERSVQVRISQASAILSSERRNHKNWWRTLPLVPLLLTCKAKPANKISFACSGVILLFLPPFLVRSLSLVPIKAAPAI